MSVLGLIGIIVALILLIVLVYKGVHVVVAGAVAAIIVAVTNSLGATEGYSAIYLGGMGGFVTGNLPIYLWGGIFGEMFNSSGAARSIAKGISKLLKGNKERAGVLTSILIVFVAGLLMSYGGISGIVLMFVLMPLTLEILKESRIPRYMAPGCWALWPPQPCPCRVVPRSKTPAPSSTWVPVLWPPLFPASSAAQWLSF